jgi:hypothetical protein
MSVSAHAYSCRSVGRWTCFCLVRVCRMALPLPNRLVAWRFVACRRSSAPGLTSHERRRSRRLILDIRSGIFACATPWPGLTRNQMKLPVRHCRRLHQRCRHDADNRNPVLAVGHSDSQPNRCAKPAQHSRRDRPHRSDHCRRPRRDCPSDQQPRLEQPPNAVSSHQPHVQHRAKPIAGLRARTVPWRETPSTTCISVRTTADLTLTSGSQEVHRCRWGTSTSTNS